MRFASTFVESFYASWFICDTSLALIQRALRGWAVFGGWRKAKSAAPVSMYLTSDFFLAAQLPPKPMGTLSATSVVGLRNCDECNACRGKRKRSATGRHPRQLRDGVIGSHLEFGSVQLDVRVLQVLNRWHGQGVALCRRSQVERVRGRTVRIDRQKSNAARLPAQAVGV